jgi:predicted flap endonuclease-1-like 5' DNA nuclease
MPELSAIHIAIIAVMTVIGALIGWQLRGTRSKQEKAAVNAGWKEQMSAQRTEHDRLTEQNKSLMEQINQYQASNIDAKNRAKELSEVIKEAFARRDELQVEIKDIRANLEVAMTERDQLQSDMSATKSQSDNSSDEKLRIAKLERELVNWQNRLPPLIEKFRQRNIEAQDLEAKLEAANARIAELESDSATGQTRIEPVRDPDVLTDGRDACNDTMQDETPDIEDQPIAYDDPEALEELGDGESDGDSDSDSDDEGSREDGFADERDRLQCIKGVGPAIEKTLNEMGIFRFQQIAEMSEYDIDRVAKRLKGFRSRIYREDWIGQARELRDQPVSG